MSTSRILSTERVKVSDIQTHPDNARKGNLEEIKTSLETHGQYRTIVVNRRNNYILAGNHTYMGIVELGWEELDVNWVEADEVAEKKILLVDNRTSDTSEYDNAKLAALLESLMLAGQLQGSGWDVEAVDDLMAEMDALPVVDSAFEGEYRESAEDTASRYREPGEVRPMRQFVFLYPEDTGTQVEQDVKKLQKVWGVSGARDVVAEAVHRCAVACEDNNSEVSCTCLQVTEKAAF